MYSEIIFQNNYFLIDIETIRQKEKTGKHNSERKKKEKRGTENKRKKHKRLVRDI